MNFLRVPLILQFQFLCKCKNLYKGLVHKAMFAHMGAQLLRASESGQSHSCQLGTSDCMDTATAPNLAGVQPQNAHYLCSGPYTCTVINTFLAGIKCMNRCSRILLDAWQWYWWQWYCAQKVGNTDIDQDYLTVQYRENWLFIARSFFFWQLQGVIILLLKCYKMCYKG